MFLKVKKIIAAGAGIVLIVAWFIDGLLANTYVSYPRSPHTEDGRTVPYAVKGIVVYITQGQRDFLSWLTWIEICSGMIALLVILIHWGDPFRSKK